MIAGTISAGTPADFNQLGARSFLSLLPSGRNIQMCLVEDAGYDSFGMSAGEVLFYDLDATARTDDFVMAIVGAHEGIYQVDGSELVSVDGVRVPRCAEGVIIFGVVLKGARMNDYRPVQRSIR
jgi:hypothetical protein